jgi:hypothetical protein
MSFRAVVGKLGLDVPADDNDLRDVLAAAIEQVHQLWRNR